MLQSLLIFSWAVTASLLSAADPVLPAHPLVGQRFVPDDVDWQRPVYASTFDDKAALKDWKLEGGRRMSIADGRLVLESHADREAKEGHLVCWLTRELPADFLVEFKMRPRDRKDGLAILFFNTRGMRGENLFDPALAPRSGDFKQYHSGELNGYHVSYWAGERGTANIRKNKGFTLVATGPDLVVQAPAESFQTIRLHKRGGHIRLMVDDIVSVAFDDDGKAHGPVWTHTGWLGLRQMAHAIRCDYDDLKIYSCKP